VDIAHLFSGSELLPPFTVSLSREGRLDQEPLTSRATTPGLSFEEIERSTYQAALDRAGGNVSAAARALRLSRASLDYRLGKLGLKR
jgi:transcriptional regulator with GAF, ATPase, and Fis domain